MAAYPRWVGPTVLLSAVFFAIPAAGQEFSVIVRPAGAENMLNMIDRQNKYVPSILPDWVPSGISIKTSHKYTDKKTKSGYFSDEIWLREKETYVKRAGRCWVNYTRNIVGMYSTVTYGKVRHSTVFGNGANVLLLNHYNLFGTLMTRKGWNSLLKGQNKGTLQWLAEQVPNTGTILEMAKGGKDTLEGLEALHKANEKLARFRGEYRSITAKIDFRRGYHVDLIADYDKGIISGAERTISAHSTRTEVACTGDFWTNATDGQEYAGAEFNLPVRGPAARALLAMMAQPAASRDNAGVARLARDELKRWSGKWSTKRGEFTIAFTGTGASMTPGAGGLFARRGGSIVVSHVTDQTLSGTWRLSEQRLEGTFRWTMKPNGREFAGQFSESIGGPETRPWSGGR